MNPYSSMVTMVLLTVGYNYLYTVLLKGTGIQLSKRYS